MRRSIGWCAIVALFAVYFGAFGFLQSIQRIEGEVRGVGNHQLVVRQPRQVERTYTLERSTRISLNNGLVQLERLSEGDEVALLLSPNGQVTEVLAARFGR